MSDEERIALLAVLLETETPFEIAFAELSGTLKWYSARLKDGRRLVVIGENRRQWTVCRVDDRSLLQFARAFDAERPWRIPK